MAMTMLGGCAGNAADEKSTKSPDQDINASEEPTVNPTEPPAEEPTEAPSEEPIVDPCSVVSFSNPIFEAVFREKYGFGDNTIYMSDILEFEVLDLSNQRLRGILDIAMFTNLTELNLGYNSISDISALANLTKLTHLDLCNNNICDISALSNLTDLIKLDLAATTSAT